MRPASLRHALVAAVVLAGAGLLAAAGASADGSGLTGRGWTATSLSKQPPVAGTTVTMRFTAAGKVSGSTGCNSYSSGYRAGARTLRIPGPIATTMMACPPATMAQEQTFVRLLGKVRRYTVRGDTLTLRGALGNELAIFSAR